MSRIITTTSPLVAARGINNGNNLSIRIRDTRSGRFVAWEAARADDFGLNGNRPFTYNHLSGQMSFRCEHNLEMACLWMRRDPVKPIPRFMDASGNVEMDRFVEFDWQTRAYPWYFKSLSSYMFELYL